MFTDTIRSMLNYAPVSKEEYGKRFVDVCIADIVKVIISSNFLAANSRATYIRYIRAVQMTVEHQGTLCFPEEQSKNALVV